jgi:hypothetical protein
MKMYMLMYVYLLNSPKSLYAYRVYQYIGQP